MQDGLERELTYKGYGAKIKWSDMVKLRILSGKDEGEIDGSVLPAQRRAEIDFGQVLPVKLNVQIQPNPILFKYGVVQAPNFLDPDEEQELKMYVNTYVSVDLSELDYLLKAYLVD